MSNLHGDWDTMGETALLTPTIKYNILVIIAIGLFEMEPNSLNKIQFCIIGTKIKGPQREFETPF